jgi:hypothetical protein
MTQNHVTTVLGCDLDLPTLLTSMTRFPKYEQILSKLDWLLIFDNAYPLYTFLERNVDEWLLNIPVVNVFHK